MHTHIHIPCLHVRTHIFLLITQFQLLISVSFLSFVSSRNKQLDSLQNPCADIGLEVPSMLQYRYQPDKEVSVQL